MQMESAHIFEVLSVPKRFGSEKKSTWLRPKSGRFQFFLYAMWRYSSRHLALIHRLAFLCLARNEPSWSNIGVVPGMFGFSAKLEFPPLNQFRFKTFVFVRISIFLCIVVVFIRLAAWQMFLNMVQISAGSFVCDTVEMINFSKRNNKLKRIFGDVNPEGRTFKITRCWDSLGRT